MIFYIYIYDTNICCNIPFFFIFIICFICGNTFENTIVSSLYSSTSSTTSYATKDCWYSIKMWSMTLMNFRRVLSKCYVWWTWYICSMGISLNSKKLLSTTIFSGFETTITLDLKDLEVLYLDIIAPTFFYRPIMSLDIFWITHYKLSISTLDPSLYICY